MTVKKRKCPSKVKGISFKNKNLFQNYLFAPILYIFVPQTGHLPVQAGLPFFIVVCSTWPSPDSIHSCLALHFTQYAPIFNSPPSHFEF